jgi:hypothetical protein
MTDFDPDLERLGDALRASTTIDLARESGPRVGAGPLWCGGDVPVAAARAFSVRCTSSGTGSVCDRPGRSPTRPGRRVASQSPHRFVVCGSDVVVLVAGDVAWELAALSSRRTAAGTRERRVIALWRSCPTWLGWSRGC